MAPGPDAQNGFFQFLAADEGEYVTRDGRLVIDDPEIRRKLIEAIDRYTTFYREGCTPPDAVNWAPGDRNNNALKSERSDDYYENTATIEWPLGQADEPFPIKGFVIPAVVFKDGDHVDTAKEFVRFLVGEGWLAHYLNFSGERLLPSLSKLLEQPFWLDPSDPHRMAAVMQFVSHRRAYNYAVVSGDPRFLLVDRENVWGNAVHRVVADGISPEQAVDEAIARIKQILSE